MQSGGEHRSPETMFGAPDELLIRYNRLGKYEPATVEATMQSALCLTHYRKRDNQYFVK